MILRSHHIWTNKQSKEAKDAASEQQKFAETLKSQYQTQFQGANQTQQYLINRLQGVFSRAAAGQGFTPETNAALQENNREQTAQTAAQASNATTRRVQQLGGGAGLATGAGAQVLGQINTQSLLSGAQGSRQIALANAGQANTNLAGATSALSGLAGQQSSLASSTGNTAVSQGGTAFNNVATAYQPSNFWSNLGTGLLSGGLNALSGGLFGAVTGGAKHGGSSIQAPGTSQDDY